MDGEPHGGLKGYIESPLKKCPDCCAASASTRRICLFSLICLIFCSRLNLCCSSAMDGQSTRAVVFCLAMLAITDSTIGYGLAFIGNRSCLLPLTYYMLPLHLVMRNGIGGAYPRSWVWLIFDTPSKGWGVSPRPNGFSIWNGFF